MIRAGELLDAIVIESRILTPDGDQTIVSWGKPETVSAKVERLSEMATRFTIRYIPEIDGNKENYRVIFNGKIWGLSSALPDGRLQILTLESDISGLVEVTTLQSTETEYIDDVPQARPAED